MTDNVSAIRAAITGGNDSEDMDEDLVTGDDPLLPNGTTTTNPTTAPNASPAPNAAQRGNKR